MGRVGRDRCDGHRAGRPVRRTFSPSLAQVRLAYICVALGVQVLALTGVNSHGFDAAMALVLLSYVALFPAVLVNLRGLRSFSLA